MPCLLIIKRKAVVKMKRMLLIITKDQNEELKKFAQYNGLFYDRVVCMCYPKDVEQIDYFADKVIEIDKDIDSAMSVLNETCAGEYTIDVCGDNTDSLLTKVCTFLKNEFVLFRILSWLCFEGNKVEKNKRLDIFKLADSFPEKVVI